MSHIFNKTDTILVTAHVSEMHKNTKLWRAATEHQFAKDE